MFALVFHKGHTFSTESTEIRHTKIGISAVTYLNVVLGMTPVSFGIQIAQTETFQLSKVNLSD